MSTRTTLRNLVTMAAAAAAWLAVGAITGDAGAAPAPAANAARAGDVQIEPATLHSLAVRWPVLGDANGDAEVRVRYRPAAGGAWRQALPLARTLAERLPPDLRVAGGTLFAGSILDLRPDTEYQVELSLGDRDGGGTTRTLILRTRAEPKTPAAIAVRRVVPAAPATPGGDGSDARPFAGLAAALAAAPPGTMLLLAPGTYREADLRLAAADATGAPIIIRGAEAASVILDGGGAPILLNLDGSRDVWVENLTLRNAATLISAARAHNLVVRRARLEVSAAGIAARGTLPEEPRGFVITDNTFAGSAEWPAREGQASTYGLVLAGSGHSIGFNAFSRLRDGVHVPDDGRLWASDLYNNDVVSCTDDGIEVDRSIANVRVYRNRITNTYAAISADPVLGGPVYIFRNTILNAVYAPFKLHGHTSGVIIAHNTSVKAGIPFAIQPDGATVSYVMSRNNIFIGSGAPALAAGGQMLKCDFDNDGYAWGSGPFVEWNGQTFRSPAETKGSGAVYSERGAVMLFGPTDFGGALAIPADPAKPLAAESNRPALAPRSPAVDAALKLPNLNDEFSGRAPDLGCCEAGRPPPAVGPRPQPAW